MSTNHPTTMHLVKHLMTEDLVAEAARERLAKQARPNRTSRQVSLELVIHALGAALIWIGGKVQGAGAPAGVAAGAGSGAH